jgi:hypothetical protein
MKIILTEDQYEQLTEMIKLDIKVGDTIMGGKFKNKKVIVKTIGKNDKGDITINGKPLLRFRIIKESNTAVLRRQNKIDELFHDYLLSHNVTPQDSFDSFFQTLCWNIAVTIVDRTNMNNDSYVTLRNQIIRFIKNNYYEEFKGWWERRQKKMGISENTNESVPKDIEKRFKTYSKLLNELTEEFDWVSKIDVKLSSTADSGGWRNEQSKPLLKISVYFKNYQKIKMTTQFELFDEIMFIHNMFFPDLTGDPLIYSDNVTAYFSTKSVFPNGKTDSFPSHNQIVSGDYDAVSQVNESTEKNKKFLKDKFGIDLDGKIKMIQSYGDLPLVFASHFYPKDFNRMLNDGGPFYVLNINKGYKIGNKYVNKLYLYRPRVDGSSYLVDQDGYNKAESTFLENLGVDVMGLTIEDLVNIYFNEEDQI